MVWVASPVFLWSMGQDSTVSLFARKKVARSPQWRSCQSPPAGVLGTSDRGVVQRRHDRTQRGGSPAAHALNRSRFSSPGRAWASNADRSSSLGETAKGLGGMKPDAIDPTAGDLARGACGGAGLKSDTNKGL